MIRAYLSLGSNIGDKLKNLHDALNILNSNKKINNMKVSSFYETNPVGYLDQDIFVNIAVEIETDLTSYELLDVCQGIEKELKRERIIRWGPRIIDVDILLYGDTINSSEKLTIPHPRMIERAFVIVPLIELNSELIISGKHIKEIYKYLDKEDINKIYQ
ncbi:2-amino-4-hydroxy-6-hydroxymethyldihydropteridine diphosphokinase [Helicovermis profundi]|uniref:2-amino-4-hydroxy-6-hydroxymethyldihydropteridine diphosphokinase n=1 Tax=Helicovermis profundi TaxID=3065157 RepID=A0AAU9EQW9_9FIRM|nr:2-amino-4-hydroxy-6-hydroxymethyldihydropteridine diphosphokinase [Clostridia bacterium S502]